MSSFLGPQAQVSIKLADGGERKTVDLTYEKGKVEKLFFFIGNDDVVGDVTITPSPGKKIEHQGMKIEFIGQIGNFYPLSPLELFYDRGNHYELTSNSAT